ncbi:sigma-70 family RNA polymerase sigma factor [Streptomyces sp. NBC_00233]|uniref:sigma-70 family RNA polymerase sigma factor n=1 Tax=Streptomyces sp. NBC_00233 TaxID=2975686 RepID=UPI002255A437|nr:sigma-70 family RNA polymerase sigma factor [Streptomyces sp. NBC_00233]MCX5231874.1 sigma-70 family RNA polymerase sigma factor [Streptomyces sp. NBC_00233]
MHSDERRTTALVEAARAGDAHARDALVRAYLPLVHNIVGRALDGHADTDDIVQETMVRALDGLTGLRDPARFRSWLVAIAMNGIRRRWRERQQAPVSGLDRAADLADPAAGDFTEVTILRLGLSGQRRDVARATRWLDEDDRELLALWWLEAAGELTRAELAEGLGGISLQHAAVRVQRMKERLETGRAVVRALDAVPICPDLAETVTAWDGLPSPLWRKRVARHARTCAACTARVTGRSGLAPVEGLLVGLGLVPPLVIGLTDGPTDGPVAFDTVASDTAVPDTTTPDTSTPGPAVSDSVSRWTPLRRAGAAGAAAVAVLGAVALLVPQEPHARMAPGSPVAAPPVTPAPTTPPATPTPTRTATPTPTTTPPTPRRTPRPTPAPTGEERVTGLVNRMRAEAGCAPLRIDPRLTAAARGYARDMAARGYFGHASPEGEFADTRITAAGYTWSAWAENLDQGTADPASVVDDWTDGSMHEENMLDCRYRDTGVASASGPGGTIWVQKLAAPAS